MELVAIVEKKMNDKHFIKYEIGGYTVDVITYDSGWRNIAVTAPWEDRYMPKIYTRDDLMGDGHIIGFEIQTTSYGALPVEDIRKVIECYEKAIQVVEILTKEFVKEA